MTSPSPLATVRRKRLLTQRDLAEKAQVAHSTIALIEAGKTTPRIKVIRQLCAVLAVQPEDVDEFARALGIEDGSGA
jgi:DNA-binding XRE family transcriptional regulator